MRRLAPSLAALTLLGTSGCIAGVLDLARGPVQPCVARYAPLTPASSVGYDGCGNFWVRDKDGCRIISDDEKSMTTIPCPAEGDTLGD